MKGKLKTILPLLLISALLCSCGASKEADGIDSVTYISEMASNAPSESAAPAADKDPALGESVLARLNGKEYSSAVYLLFMQEALDSVLSKYDAEPADVPGLDVMLADGSVISGKEFCEAYARNEFEWVCLLSSEFTESGREINESDYYMSAAAGANEKYKLNAAKFESLGIGLDDLILYNIYTDLYYENFTAEYSPGGANEIPEADLEALMNNTVRKISYTYLPFYDEGTNKDFSEAEKAELTGIAKEYLARYKNGESFSDIVSENYMLLDSYGVIYDPEGTVIYYPIADPMLPEAITDKVETLKENEAALVTADDYVSVVLRLPVNETKDRQWLDCALEQAYQSPYGDGYAETVSAMYESLDLDYDGDVLDQLTLENYISAAY